MAFLITTDEKQELVDCVEGAMRRGFAIARDGAYASTHSLHGSTGNEYIVWARAEQSLDHAISEMKNAVLGQENG